MTFLPSHLILTTLRRAPWIATIGDLQMPAFPMTLQWPRLQMDLKVISKHSAACTRPRMNSMKMHIGRRLSLLDPGSRIGSRSSSCLRRYSRLCEGCNAGRLVDYNYRSTRLRPLHQIGPTPEKGEEIAIN